MKVVHKFVEAISEEMDGAKMYAEKYIEHKTSHPQWAKMYSEMAANELNHADYLHMIGQETIDNLSWVSEEDKEVWEKCGKRATEKGAVVKLMLTK